MIIKNVIKSKYVISKNSNYNHYFVIKYGEFDEDKNRFKKLLGQYNLYTRADVRLEIEQIYKIVDDILPMTDADKVKRRHDRDTMTRYLISLVI